MRTNDNENQVETAAIKALAVASKTPFKTAFMATLGVGLAQLAFSLIFFGSLAALATIAYLVVR